MTLNDLAKELGRGGVGIPSGWAGWGRGEMSMKQPARLGVQGPSEACLAAKVLGGDLLSPWGLLFHPPFVFQHLKVPQSLDSCTVALPASAPRGQFFFPVCREETRARGDGTYPGNPGAELGPLMGLRVAS